MKICLTLITTLIVLIGCGQMEQTHTEQQKTPEHIQNTINKNEINEILDRYKQQYGFMGSVAIRQNDELVYTYVTGYSDYENNKLATVNTKYRIGSITKSYTAVLILMAVEDAKLSLNHTLSSFFPQIVNADKITIQQMLDHSSGIPSYTKEDSFRDIYSVGITEESMINFIHSLGSEFEPGTNTSYSNSNYYLLTLILERVFGQSYSELIENKISAPLALQRTYHGDSLSGERDEAFSYHNENEIVRYEEAHPSVLAGAGGIVSTPTELAKFYVALFEGEIIAPSTLSTMLEMNNNFGLGIQAMGYAGKTSYGHRGRIDEFNSLALYNPEEKLSIAIIDNSSFSEVPAIAKDILHSYFSDISVPISEEELEKFVGVYKSLNPNEHDTVFEKEGNKLILVIANEYRNELIYKGNNTFLFDQSYAPSFDFIFSEDGKKFKHKPNGEYRAIKQ
ncbi:serine hydrolase domain-containing protein [Alteromonas facilis]|uniref:serine hydrolase domain-containing protein n=1 Tax=Alteromonas facilis TaxID=2048004 RepID=UPI000C294176|nr:serine hydrolase domain-containing protein [Alteromonas facilis]